MNIAMAADEGRELPVDSKPVKPKIEDAPPESDTVQGDQPQT
jgi:hypothetical protein